MKILMIVPSFKKVGPINVSLGICKYLNKFSTVDILALDDGELNAEFVLFTNRCIVLSGNYISKFLSLNQAIKKNNYDLVHSHCLLPDLFNAMNALFNKNVTVCTLHNYFDIDYISSRGLFIGKLMSISHRAIVKKINHKISCSESVKEHIFSNFKIESNVIRNGVDFGVNKMLLSNTIDFVILGVLNERKNSELAINAFCLASIDNSTLTVIGHGKLFDLLLKKYACKNIFFVGNVSNPRNLLEGKDILLSSSLAEGLPLALLECMSEGLTYIVSDIMPHKEVHNIDISSGVIVSNILDEFVFAIKSISISNLIQMKEKSKKLHAEHFSSEIMGDNYCRLYNEICA